MYQQQQRRLEGVAGLLAKQGRYGDSMLVHMNPIEVEGLASMSPTGSLTVNPETGQPEAFLPFLAPLLGSLVGSSALTGLGATAATAGLSSAAAGAIGSGLASWAATGDLKQGLVSGITGFGIGSALGGIGAAGTEGIESGLTETIKSGGGVDAITGEALPMMSPHIPSVKSPSTLDMLNTAAGVEAVAYSPLGGEIAAGMPAGSFGDRVGDIFSKEGVDALISPQALVPAAVAEGYNAEMVAEEAMRNFDKASGEMSEAELARQREAILANQFNPNLAPAPYDPGGTDYGAQYANAGGIVSLDPSDFRRRYNGLMGMGRPTVGMQAGGATDPWNPANIGDHIVGQVGGYGNPLPARQQAALRGPNVISPEQLQDAYGQQGLPGFGPELMYFSPEKGINPNPFQGWVPDPETPETPLSSSPESAARGSYSGPPTGGDAPNTTDQFIMVDLSDMGGGITWVENPNFRPTNGTTGGEDTSSGLSVEDQIDLYSRYMNYGRFYAEGGETQVNAEADRLLDLAAMAVLGELPEEEAEVVIQAFIDEFGEEAFSTLRESVLEGIVPGSQKEGEIVGPGGGMDDQIMGMIGNQQPVAVSPGEYIVPADVVSGIGDGSTDAGVQQLDGMLDRVRVERTNTTQQPRPLRKGGVLPR